MTEPLGAFDATQQAIEQAHGPDYRLGTATQGHVCASCRCATLETAPLLKCSIERVEIVAWFSHCACFHCS